MTTDRRDHDGVAELAHRVHDHSRAVIEAELRRLARRVPALRRVELEVIDAALDDLVEGLVVARLRTAAPEAAPLLRRIFDISDR